MNWWESDQLAGPAPVAQKWWENDATVAPPQTESALSDVIKSAPAGVVKGASLVAGLPGDLRNLVGAGVEWAGNKLGIPAPPQIRPPANGLESLLEGASAALNPPTSQDVQKSVETNLTGPLHVPSTTAGRYAETIGEFAPAALAGPGSLARRALTQTVLPAVGSETAGEMTTGTPLEPYARIAGAVAAGSIPQGLERARTPFPSTPARQAAVDTLQNEGVDALTAGQRTGHKGLQYLESELGGHRIGTALERQAEQFTSAALRRVGENANRATPDVMDRAFTRIGGQFDALAARNALRPDPRLFRELSIADSEYRNLVPQSQRAPVVQSQINDILDAAAKGPIDGDIYSAWRSRLDKQARGAMRSDPQLGNALFDIRNALDGAIQRSISPADRAAWQDARRQYRDILVIEKALGGGGEQAGQGLITPARLRMAAAAQNKRQFIRGRNNFADLAQAGQTIMTPLPQSGTGPRAWMHVVPAAMGMTAGHILGGEPAAALGIMAGVAAPNIAGRAILSPLVQRYLSNQAILAQARRHLTPAQRATLALILAGGPHLALQ